MFICTPRHVNTLTKQKSVVKREVGRAGGIQFEISPCSAVFFPHFFFVFFLRIEIGIDENMGNANVGLKWNKKNWRHKRESRMNRENIMGATRRSTDEFFKKNIWRFFYPALLLVSWQLSEDIGTLICSLVLFKIGKKRLSMLNVNEFIFNAQFFAPFQLVTLADGFSFLFKYPCHFF